MTDILPISSEQHKRLRRDLERARDAISAALQKMDGVFPDIQYTAEEREVFEWLACQDGEVTAQQVARAVFPKKSQGRPLSTAVSYHLRAAGWTQHRKAGGNRYWKRGPQARSEHAAMPAPTDT